MNKSYFFFFRVPYLNNLRIAEHRLERVQGPVGPLDPDEQLAESVLELSQAEEGILQLLLPIVDGPVEVVPTSVDVSHGLADGAGLGRGGLLREVAGLPVIAMQNISFRGRTMTEEERLGPIQQRQKEVTLIYK